MVGGFGSLWLSFSMFSFNGLVVIGNGCWVVGVYMDLNGKLYDIEYDLFVGVKDMIRVKLNCWSVFGSERYYCVGFFLLFFSDSG